MFDCVCLSLSIRLLNIQSIKEKMKYLFLGFRIIELFRSVVVKKKNLHENSTAHSLENFGAFSRENGY